MRIPFYKQAETDDPLVCPYDGSELLVSEFGETYVCEDHYHDVSAFDAVLKSEYFKKRGKSRDNGGVR